MHIIFIISFSFTLRLIEKRVINAIKKNEDVRGYSFVPILTKYHKTVRDDYESHPHTWGDNK